MLSPRRGWLDEALRGKGAGRRQAKDAKAALQRLKLGPLSDEEVLAQLEVEDLGLAYEVESDRQQVMQLDYPDVLRHAQRILENPVVAGLYKRHFGHILVDEFQDLTNQQADVILSISENNVTWAGDPGQAIYSFTGANPVALEARLRKMVSQVHTLDETHRSSPAVVSVLNAIGNVLELPELRCAKPERWRDGGAAFAYTFKDRRAEAGYLRFLAEQIAADDPDASIGIITRVEFRREQIDDEFAKNYPGPVKFWTSAVTSSRTAQLLTRSLESLGDAVLSSIDGISELLELTRSVVDDSEIDCIDELRLCDMWLRDAVDSGLSLPAAVQRIQVSDDPGDAVPPGVHLLNAHVGKGQQFDHVIVSGVERDLVPSKWAKTDAEIQEELRVLRVMVSRAGTSCVFTRTRFRDGFDGGAVPVRESRWWSTVACACHD